MSPTTPENSDGDYLTEVGEYVSCPDGQTAVYALWSDAAGNTYPRITLVDSVTLPRTAA